MYHISATWPSTGHENDNLPTRLHQHLSQMETGPTPKMARPFIPPQNNQSSNFCLLYGLCTRNEEAGGPLLISSSSLSNNGMHLKICQELYFSRLSTGRSRMYGMMLRWQRAELQEMKELLKAGAMMGTGDSRKWGSLNDPRIGRMKGQDSGLATWWGVMANSLIYKI